MIATEKDFWDEFSFKDKIKIYSFLTIIYISMPLLYIYGIVQFVIELLKERRTRK